MLLLHIKAVTGEYYLDIKKRIDMMLLEPNIETFNRFKRDSVQALLCKDNFFNIKFLKENEESNSQENKTSTNLTNRLG